jgi:hypothetical protein
VYIYRLDQWSYPRSSLSRPCMLAITLQRRSCRNRDWKYCFKQSKRCIFTITLPRRSYRGRAWKYCSKQSRPFTFTITLPRRSYCGRAWKYCSKQSRPFTFTITLPRPSIAVELGNIVLSNRDRLHLPLRYQGLLSRSSWEILLFTSQRTLKRVSRLSYTNIPSRFVYNLYWS